MKKKVEKKVDKKKEIHKELLKTVRSHGQVFKLKVGEVIRFDTDIEHYYWINGKFVPAVSRILNDAAPVGFGLREFWKTNTKEESENILRTAGDFGSKIHDACEKLLKGLELNLLEDYATKPEKKCLTAFADWFQKYAPENFEAEQVVASKKFKYAGTLDFIGKIAGEIWLIDFKTTNAIHFSHKLQVLAYKQAYEESFKVKIDKLAILRLGTGHKGNGFKKEGLPEIGPAWECKIVEPELSIKSFMNVYKTFIDMNGGKIPEPEEIVSYPDVLQIIEKVEEVKNAKNSS